MKSTRGDTIIEVILAVTIFSLVAVGAMSVMGRGVAMAQKSLEITQVRQQIDAQAELLRYISSPSSASDPVAQVWRNIKHNKLITGGGAPKSIIDMNECPQPGEIPHRFVLQAFSHGLINYTDNYQASPDVYAKVADSGSQGISIQLMEVAGGNAYDAYIQACWYGLGSSVPITLGTIVRIYDTRG